MKKKIVASVLTAPLLAGLALFGFTGTAEAAPARHLYKASCTYSFAVGTDTYTRNVTRYVYTTPSAQTQVAAQFAASGLVCTWTQLS